MNEEKLPEQLLAELNLLRERQAELVRSEARLAVQYQIARILADATTITQATGEILQVICQSFDWQFGALWVVEGESGLLGCIDIWHEPNEYLAEFRASSLKMTFASGVGLPGRTLLNAEPIWIGDVSKETSFPRLSIAERERIVSAVAFPILLHNEVLGVMEFFSKHYRAPDQELLKVMSAIGSNLGIFIERRYTEQALRESEARHRIIAETASDAIITIDQESRIIFANNASEVIFGYRVDELISMKLEMLMPARLRAQHAVGIKRYLTTGKRRIPWQRVELPGLHRSGRELTLEISFGEYIENNRHLFTSVIRDITERKLAEAERQRTDLMIRRLQTITDVALSHLSLDDLLRELLRRISESLAADTAAILLVSEDGNYLEHCAAIGVDEESARRSHIPLGAGFAGRIAVECKPLLINDFTKDPFYLSILHEMGLPGL